MKIKTILMVAALGISLSACDVISTVHLAQSRAVMSCGEGVTVGHVRGTSIYTYTDRSTYGDLEAGTTPEQFCERVNSHRVSMDNDKE